MKLPLINTIQRKVQFSSAIRKLQIGKLLCKANITKNCGIPAYGVFQFLLLLIFQGKNLFRFLNSKHRNQAVSKNTYYHFLNEISYNRKRFLLLLTVKVSTAFARITSLERVKVLILDDSGMYFQSAKILPEARDRISESQL